MERIIVNFGCGPTAPNGYVNIDGSLTVLLARLPLPTSVYGPKAAMVQSFRAGEVRYGNARRLNLAHRSIDGFYASHVLEHMSRKDCIDLLKRVRGWLKPAGILRVVLPDLNIFALQYTKGQITADRFVTCTGLAIDNMPIWKIILCHYYHRWMYDAPAVASLLESLGYRQVKICQWGWSALPELAALDSHHKERAPESFYVEAAP